MERKDADKREREDKVIATNEERRIILDFMDWGGMTTEIDWNTLMPVVEKINRLDDQIHFDLYGIKLIRAIRHFLELVNIQDAHKAVAEFIKWHNSVTPETTRQ
jgi:hypothetical protein